jgi:hypothetical protein
MKHPHSLACKRCSPERVGYYCTKIKPFDFLHELLCFEEPTEVAELQSSDNNENARLCNRPPDETSLWVATVQEDRRHDTSAE